MLDPEAPTDTRAGRARAEPMAVTATGGGRYAVRTAADRTYVVTLPGGRCTCPDSRLRGAHCKHVRRVALEVTEGLVPAPGQRRTVCGDCATTLDVAESAVDPVYCPDCTLAPGTPAVDRETGDLVVVVEQTAARADTTPVPDSEHTVASYPGNEDYAVTDAVVAVIYPLPAGLSADAVRRRRLRAYSFPRGRLRVAGAGRR